MLNRYDRGRFSRKQIESAWLQMCRTESRQKAGKATLSLAFGD